MYRLDDLKQKIEITEHKIECPIKECDKIVDRKRRSNNHGKNFICPNHKIQITPSTFIYKTLIDNLLWYDNNDKELLDEIFKVKRECRMSNDNSEDATCWNVIRYLEKNNLLSLLLDVISNNQHKIVDIIYWSYSQNEKKLWSSLKNARLEFGESVEKGSEPDIIVLTDKTIFFIEAKLFSSNRTSGTGETLSNRITNKKKYVSGGNCLFSKLFKSDYESIVIDQKYELMRFWILGTWIAKELNLNFHLINLVLNDKELDIENDFGKHLLSNSKFKLSRFTWESIFTFVKNKTRTDNESLLIMDYFNYKTAGYDSKGLLQKAFNTNK